MSDDRFECPCHGSKFTREGLYIEGPAPRSLDTFVTALEDDIWVVDTGAKILGAPSANRRQPGPVRSGLIDLFSQIIDS